MSNFFGPRGTKLGFGFVTFKTATDADFAVYRLNGADLGGKVLVKAMIREAQERKGGAPGTPPQRNKRPKKPMTSLVTLTPKNYPTPPPTDSTDSPKKAWDLPAAGTAHTKGPRGNQKKFEQNGQTVVANPGSNQNPRAPKAKQPSPNQGAQVTDSVAQNQPPAQNPATPPQGKGVNAKKGKNPAQNQTVAAPAHQNQPPAQTQNQVNSQGHQNQPAPANAAGGKKKRGPKNRNFAFTVNVVDPKTGLTLHVLQLSQESYDKNILPLVTKH